MHWLIRIAIIIAGNAFALWVANKVVPGFVVDATWLQLIVLALILAILNFILKPILTLVFGPIIVITLGLGVIIVNAVIVWLLPIVAGNIDFLKGSISIQSNQEVSALIFGTLVISVVNFLIHIAL